MPDELTELENASIRKFLHSVADEGYFKGKVFDYGCGRQPYRRLVEEHGGDYYGYDRADNPANMGGKDIGSLDHFGFHRYADAVLCTQVVQFLDFSELFGDEETVDFFGRIAWILGYGAVRKSGHLVLTYPTNWPEVQEADLHRFTKVGMERLLTEAGFSILRHERRATIHALGYEWALGYGVVARA